MVEASTAPATLFAAAGDGAAAAGDEAGTAGDETGTAGDETGTASDGAADDAGAGALPPLLIAFCCACKVVETAGHPTPGPFRSCSVINAAVILAD